MLVRFSDDPRLWHLRIVLSRRDEDSSQQQLTVLTPDREVEALFVPGDNIQDVKIYEGRVPAGVNARNLYLDSHSGAGRFTAVELNQYVEQYENRDHNGVAFRLGTAPGSVGTAVRTRLAGKQAVVTPGGRTAMGVHGSDGLAWRLVSGGLDGSAFGDAVALPPTAVVTGDFAIVPDPGGIGGALLQRLDGGDLGVARGAAWDAVRQTFSREVDELTAGDGRGEGTDELDDVRILPISYDETNSRFLRLDAAAPQMLMKDFEDWPMDNVRSAGFMVRELRRDGKNFSQAHTDWVRSSGIRGNDRAVFEHKTLSKVLDLAVGYDQLNIVNLASMECVIKRRMLIEKAYHGRPEAPRYDGSEYFMGFRDSDCGEYVDPAAVKHESQRIKAETEAMRELRLAREESKNNSSSKAGAGGKG